MTSFLAIVKLTCRSAVRSHVFQFLLFILLLGVFLVPNTIKGDGTPYSYMQVSLEYSLTFITVMLMLSGVWLGCQTMTADVEDCRLHLIVVKPISRYLVWLGKLTGVLVVLTSLLIISAAVIYGFILYQYSRQDFSKEEILHVLEVAKEFEKDRSRKILEGKVVGSLFFEPSTRTRLSFETAVNRLGARVIGFSDATNTSVSKGETLKDTIKMVSNYVDLIVMRHPLEGSSRYASEVASVPVINAGDGANQHPSQTLLDLYTIMQTQGRLEGLTINMVGDLKYGRTTHSLLQAMSHFSPEFIFTAPEELKMPAEYKSFLDSKGIPYRETTSLEEHLNDCDILYMTRVQQERFNDLMEYEKVKDVYRLTASMLCGVKPNMKILHPLPRVGEIDQDVDDTPYAYYFKQAENGLYVRMAIISYLLGYR